jgi:AcrR family transcriptional regulator
VTTETPRRARQRAATTARLAEAVERLLAEDEPYLSLSVERVVQEAGIARGTFYAYFDDKADLLRALTVRVSAELLGTADEWWELPIDAPKTDVRAALDHLFARYLPHRNLLGAIVEGSTYDERVQAQFFAMIADGVDRIAARIQRGQDAGIVRPELDAKQTAAWFGWMFERGLYELSRPDARFETDRLVMSLNDLMWNVLHEAS